MQHLVRDITSTMQTLRFAVAVVLSTMVTSVVAGPMAYQAVRFEPESNLGAATGGEGLQAAATTPETPAAPSALAGTSASASRTAVTVSAPAEPDVAATPIPTTLPAAPAAPPTTTISIAAAPAARATGVNPPTATSATQPQTTNATSPPVPSVPPPTAVRDPDAIGDLGPFGITTSCGDLAYELDQDRPGLCDGTNPAG